MKNNSVINNSISKYYVMALSIMIPELIFLHHDLSHTLTQEKNQHWVQIQIWEAQFKSLQQFCLMGCW